MLRVGLRTPFPNDEVDDIWLLQNLDDNKKRRRKEMVSSYPQSMRFYKKKATSLPF